MNRMLLDSVIIIDHLNGIKDATAFIANNIDKIYISVITRAEVLAGCSDKTINKIKRFLNQIPTLAMTVKDADEAARYRKSLKIRLPDAIQISIATNNNLILVTRNTKDFKKNKIQNLLVPYKV